ncbi:MAG TPA: bifunctional DNA primase/polymerase, partial [Longimicrobiales bacterium]|nr:bifunctional DNA primase/polymerase [Longimicrobiales bacterium]
MSATKLFDAGYTDLVSVIPPDARISGGSRILPRTRGKVPGLKGSNGWYGYAFTAKPATREDAEKWERWGSNIGLLGDRFPAVDIDVDDAYLAESIRSEAESSLGPAPIRVSRGPRRLLVYRTEDPFTKMAAVLTKDDTTHLVEILGKGRQYLIEGKHPSGTKYRWRRTLPRHPSELTEITREDAQAFLQAVKAKAETGGWEVELIGDGLSASDTAPPQDSLLAPSIEELQRLMAELPNPTSWGRDRFVEVGYAVKAAGQEDPEAAFSAWTEWASRWEGDGSDDPDKDRSEWERFQPPYRVGWTWLEDLAEDTGAYDVAQAFFEADPDAAPPPAPAINDHVVHTDEWAVSRILPDLEPKVRYSVANDDWMLWSGYKWYESKNMEYEILIRDRLRDMAATLQAYAQAAPGNQGKPLFSFAKKLQSASGIRAVTQLLRARLAVNPTDFDVEPMVLNTPAGPIDLATGEPTMDDDGMHARATGVAPAEGEHSMWSAFLRDLTGDDQDLIRYLQKVAGYALTGQMG